MTITYPSTNTVSIWIGTFGSENEFDSKVDEVIASSLPSSVELSSISEVTYEPASIEISDLLNGFSGWKTFAEAAATVAAQRGIKSANAAIVCYYLRSEEPLICNDSLRFLGSFHGNDIDSK